VLLGGGAAEGVRQSAQDQLDELAEQLAHIDAITRPTRFEPISMAAGPLALPQRSPAAEREEAAPRIGARCSRPVPSHRAAASPCPCLLVLHRGADPPDAVSTAVPDRPPTAAAGCIHACAQREVQRGSDDAARTPSSAAARLRLGEEAGDPWAWPLSVQAGSSADQRAGGWWVGTATPHETHPLCSN
jgi:hypothetical protein